MAHYGGGFSMVEAAVSNMDFVQECQGQWNAAQIADENVVNLDVAAGTSAT